MKCLIVGGQGQVGSAIQATAPSSVSLFAPTRGECDLTAADQVENWLVRVRPDILFNAAAYTAVDAAEGDPAAADRVNGEGPGVLAEAARRYGARLVHISTDFVFDGQASQPYSPAAQPNPLSVYGRTKLRGEVEAQRAGRELLIVRTSWVYAERGKNFVHTMLKLMRERDEVRVVADQIGTPTYARNLGRALWGLCAANASGIYHFTDEGVASWYDFAMAIQEEALALGILRTAAKIIPIATNEYPTPAKRPGFSVLDKSKTRAAIGSSGQHWRAALRDMLGKVNSDG